MTPSWPKCFLESINSFAIITPSQICLLWTKAPWWGLIISRRTDFKQLANILASTFVNTSHQANWSKIRQFHRIWNVRNKCNKGEINLFIQPASFVKFIEHDSKIILPKIQLKRGNPSSDRKNPVSMKGAKHAPSLPWFSKIFCWERLNMPGVREKNSVETLFSRRYINVSLTSWAATLARRLLFFSS